MTQARPGGNGFDPDAGALNGLSAVGADREESEGASPSIEEDDTLDFLEESDEVTDDSDE